MGFNFTAIKFNFNEGQLNKNNLFIENVKNFRWLYWVKYLAGWKMLISCVKYFELNILLGGWMEGRKDGGESRVKDCLQQSKRGGWKGQGNSD